MARQKSEDRVVPDARGNPSGTRTACSGGGGKAIPVKEVDRQLMLLDATADNPRIVRGAEGRRAADLFAVRRPTALKAASKRKTSGPVTMEPPGGQAENRVAQRLLGASVPLGAQLQPGGGPRTPQRVFRRAGVRDAAGTVPAPSGRTSAPRRSYNCAGIPRGRNPAGDGGHNPSSRRAGCEQHKSGSVGGARGNPGAYPTRVSPRRCVLRPRAQLRAAHYVRRALPGAPTTGWALRRDSGPDGCTSDL